MKIPFVDCLLLGRVCLQRSLQGVEVEEKKQEWIFNARHSLLWMNWIGFHLVTKTVKFNPKTMTMTTSSG